MRSNQGFNIGLQALGVGAAVAVEISRAHEAGTTAVLQQRIDREEASYAAAVGDVLEDAEALGDIALRLVQQLAAARAENANLKRSLAQRQAFIDRMKSRLGEHA